ncbi:D123-domain-containing protein [Westerdykella ornata]|uniref:D123-domain-containing protein n=1 Tax=Westerdykella ornata TaxID=318751 RepID=A0A6A6JG65_WESOR|nr:D123-domain-containing protein [Westerdykella ornata]KAF2274199.1 D123-domain-containing protein [Westerdykella ornata]
MAETEAPKLPEDDGQPGKLPFPPLTKQHILNCSYHSWHPKYRAITPKARLIPLPDSFLEYLRGDGIVLPPEDADRAEWSDGDSGIFTGTENDDEDDADEANADPSTQWRETHAEIERIIDELGGKVAPKLNWSAPKDATWIAATNSMECRTPNDIYLLLKSSDFVTHDLQHAFDDTEEVPEVEETPTIPYHLVLRKWILLNPSVEFRCFVRNRKLIALCQRDLNHFEFLFSMKDRLLDRIREFFEIRLKDTFPDPNFTFDVYVPPPHDRVWLMDINPWAQRTDPLLFSWMELLTLPEPAEPVAYSTDESEEDEVIEPLFIPEFRLVRRDDPEAYNFNTPQYSAHKLPKDVVDASRGGEGVLREFAMQWQEAQRLAEQQAAEDSEND